ncbi:MAG: hypothetical protein Tsb005_20560 [Gammaproteobacteria bacterium]
MVDEYLKLECDHYVSLYDHNKEIGIRFVIAAIFLINNDATKNIEYIIDKSFDMFRAIPKPAVNQTKIHITLATQDYLDHSESINKILIKYVKDETLVEFKFFPLNLVRYFLSLSASKEIPPDVDRYLNGDQFTVYFPVEKNKTFDLEKIATLCREIDAYCSQHALAPGKHTEVETRVSKYLVLRKDFYKDEYVSALTEDKTIIDTLKHEQESGVLYKKLSSLNLTPLEVNQPSLKI